MHNCMVRKAVLAVQQELTMMTHLHLYDTAVTLTMMCKCRLAPASETQLADAASYRRAHPLSWSSITQIASRVASEHRGSHHVA